MNRNLVVISVGPNPVPVEREPGANWDWLDLAWHPDAEYRGSTALAYDLDASVRKFEAYERTIHHCDYDAIAFLDDDIVPAPGVTWSAIFDLFREMSSTPFCYAPNIAMPALTRDSYYSHAITLQEPDCKWREVSYMDLMCPILSRSAYERYSPAFRGAGNSWGLEMIWSVREREQGFNLGILDATPVRHTRPVGSSSGYSSEQAMADMAKLLEREKCPRVNERVVYARHT